MTDGTGLYGAFRGKEAIDLAKDGKNEWNKWAQENPGRDVSFSGYDFSNENFPFSGFIFPGTTYFSECVFGKADFSGARFEGNVYFEQSRFSEQVDFRADFKDVWFYENAYFGRTVFNRGVSFHSARFLGKKVSFNKAKFLRGHASFCDTKFCVEHVNFCLSEFHKCESSFERTQFGGNTRFHMTVFDRSVRFNGAHFDQNADFSSVDFQHAVYLDRAEFDQVPDFRYSTLVRHLSLHGMQVRYSDHKERVRFLFCKCKKATAADDADKFRRLKEMAINSKDHDRELEFFASELKAKRFYETKNPGGLAWSYLYEWFSNFGRSVYRPLVSLYAFIVFFGYGYWLSALFSVGGTDRSFDNGLKFSASVLLPFIAAAREGYGDLKTALYGPSTGWFLDVVVGFESTFGLAFVFLIGLALRNRFRI